MARAREMCVASYQGQPGAFSEQAARRMCGIDAALLPCDTLADAFAAVTDGRALSTIVPIENTLAGTVPGIVNLLLTSGLVVHGEVTEWIDHVLAARPGTTLDAVREVASHPVALAQCTRFFTRHPAIRAVPVFDTAGALKMVMDGDDASRAAIAGRSAAELYGATLLAEHLQDHDENYTRFMRVGPPPWPAVDPGASRVLLAVRLAHRTGTLAALLQTLANAGANLTRIDSAPVPGCPFEYEFLLEGVLDRSTDIDRVVGAMCDGATVRVIGCFGAGLPAEGAAASRGRQR